MKNIIYILFFIVSFNSLKAQSDVQISEIIKLERELDEAVDDTLASRLCWLISSKYILLNLDNSDFFLEKYRKYIKSTDDESLGKYYYTKSNIYVHKKDYTLSELYLDSAFNKIKAIGDTLRLASIYNNYAFLYIQKGRYILAYDNIKSAQNLLQYKSSSRLNHYLKYNSYFIEIHSGNSINDETIIDLKREYSDVESQNDLYYLLINLNLQATVNLKRKKYKDAFQNLLKAKELNAKSEMPVVFWNTLILSGDLNFELNNYSGALEDYKSANAILFTQGIDYPACLIKIARSYNKLNLTKKWRATIASIDTDFYSGIYNFDSAEFLEQACLFYREIGEFKNAIYYQTELIKCIEVIYQKSLSQISLEDDTQAKSLILNNKIKADYNISEIVNTEIEFLENEVSVYKFTFISVFLLVLICSALLILAVYVYFKRNRKLITIKLDNSLYEAKKVSTYQSVLIAEGENKLLSKQSVVSGVTDMAVFVINSSSDILWKNSLANTFFDIYNDFSDNNITNLFNSKMSQSIKDLIVEVAMNKKSESIVDVFTDRNNKKKWLNIAVIPFEDNNGLDYYGIICSDISSYKFREFELDNQYQMIKNQRDEIKKQNREIESQNLIVSNQRLDILDSIKYSHRIQLAVYPKDDFLSTLFVDYLLINKPKNILSNGFYWARKKQNRIYVAVGNSNSKDVPGALTSMMIYTLLDDILMNFNHSLSCDMINEIQSQIQSVLDKLIDFDESLSKVQISLIIYDIDTKILQFSGAKSDLIILSHTNAFQLIGDDSSLNILERETHSFLNHSIKMEDGDQVFLFSNGVSSMFDGDNYLQQIQSFKEKLLDFKSDNMTEAEKKLDFYLFDSKIHKHREDILILGFLIS